MARINSRPKPKRWAKEDRGFDKTYRPEYTSTRWRKFSRSFRKDNPLCNECGRDATGRRGVVDHVVPVRESGDFWGGPFQTLCTYCHNRKSRAERGNK